MSYVAPSDADAFPAVNSAADGNYYGRNGADRLGHNNASARMYGGEGNDTLYQSGNFYLDAFGGNGNDWLVVINTQTSGDYLYGGAGNDVIQSYGGSDYLEGGQGIDALQGGDGSDTIYGGDGNDAFGGNILNPAGTITAGAPYAGWTITTAGGLYGGNGNDFLDGGNGNDLLDGGADNDTLLGGSGTDVLVGRAGNDVMFGGSGADTMDGGAGLDTMFGGGGDDDLYGATGDDRMYGEEGADFVYGDAGNDVVSGGAENDDVRGGNGIDAVFGGGGNDYLIGGTNIGTGDGSTDYFYAFDEGTVTNETDFILDFEDSQFGASANDFIVLEQSMADNMLIFDASGYTWIAIPTATGFHYLGATGTSASAIVNNITYV